LRKGKNFHEIRLEKENDKLRDDNSRLRDELASANISIQMLKKDNESQVNKISDKFEKLIELEELIANFCSILFSSDIPPEVLEDLSQLLQDRHKPYVSLLSDDSD